VFAILQMRDNTNLILILIIYAFVSATY